MSRFERAYGMPLGRASIRTINIDFVVEEQLGFDASGEGQHWMMLVEKDGINTLDMLNRLAKEFGVSKRDLGWSGLKDRHAVTRQFVTAPASVHDFDDDKAPDLGDHLRILSAVRHAKKLKRGVHRGNRFKLRLRDVDAPCCAVEQRLEQIRELGFPNYFGPQRFGHHNSNFENGRKLLIDPRFKRPHGDKQKMYMSAVRAWLFNHVLSSRISEQNWNQPLRDDLLILNGTNSFFIENDDLLGITRRLGKGNVHISGPLWGVAGKSHPESLITRERDWLAPFSGECNRLAQIGFDMARRPLRALPANLVWEWQSDTTLLLKFELQSGVFATSLLRELVQGVDHGGNPHRATTTGLQVMSLGPVSEDD